MMKVGGIWDCEFRNADLELEAFLKLISMRKTKHVEDWEAVAKLKNHPPQRHQDSKTQNPKPVDAFLFVALCLAALC